MARQKVEIGKDIFEEVKRRKKREKESKIYRRLLFLEMKYQKKSHKEIALLLDVTQETLSHWTAIFLKGGIDLLCKLHYEGRRESVLQPLIQDITHHIETENVSSLKELQSWLKNTKGVDIGISWLQEFCKKKSIFPTKRHGSYQGNIKRKKSKRNVLKKSSQKYNKQKSQMGNTLS